MNERSRRRWAPLAGGWLLVGGLGRAAAGETSTATVVAPAAAAPSTSGVGPAIPSPAAFPGLADPAEEEGEGGALPGGPDPQGTPLLPANPGISAVERGPERWTPPAALLDAVRAARLLPIGDRIEAASHPLLGLPYLNDAAGEGEGIDPDPPSRFDAFDCLTFVEEMVGLALAGDPLSAPSIRNALRYDGPHDYAHRRHFMEAEWIPDAIRNGLVEDITARMGRARTLEKDVSLDTWHAWRRRGLFKLPDDLLPVGTWSLTYLDLAEAADAASRIPPGAIVVTLRADRAYVPVVVTHISLVVPPPPGSPPGAEPRMRHATRMGLRTVRDDRLGWYLTHLRDYVNWPALGVTVLLPREQGPRLSALHPVALPDPFPPAEGPLPHFEPRPIPPFDPQARRPTPATKDAP